MRRISFVHFILIILMTVVILLMITGFKINGQPRRTLNLKQNTTIVKKVENFNLKQNTTIVKKVDKTLLFLFSAVAELDSSSSTNYSRIILTAWDGSSKSFNCYFKIDKIFTLVPAVEIRAKDHNARFICKHFACDISFLSKLPQEIALVESIEHNVYPISIEKHFIKNNDSAKSYFHKIYYPERKEGELAICTKIAYDHLDPNRLIEWFEYQKLMGVDKVVSAIQSLNIEAVQVLEHYRREGILDIIKYPNVLPSHNAEYAQRGFDVKHRVFPQFFHDEQISVFHCMGVLQGYEFVSVTDFDEFIVPAKQENIKQLLKDELLKEKPKAAGFTFHVSFFLMDTNKTEKSDLVTAKYLYKVGPRWECYKTLFLSDRVDMYSTHTFNPKSGFSGEVVSPEVAVLHHYRQCPGGQNWGNCTTQKRDKDTVMTRHTKELEDRVRKAKKQIKKITINRKESEFL